MANGATSEFSAGPDLRELVGTVGDVLVNGNGHTDSQEKTQFLEIFTFWMTALRAFIQSPQLPAEAIVTSIIHNEVRLLGSVDAVINKFGRLGFNTDELEALIIQAQIALQRLEADEQNLNVSQTSAKV